MSQEPNRFSQEEINMLFAMVMGFVAGYMVAALMNGLVLL
jgi:hypothetical protein